MPRKNPLASIPPERLERLLLLMDPAHKTGNSIKQAEDSYRLLAPHLLGFEEERLVVLFLDRRLRPIAIETLTIGNDAHTVVCPKQIFRRAILHNAAGIVMGHNHPSGDPEPSPEDFAVTKQIASSGGILGIHLVDHIVVGNPPRWVSIAERGGVPKRVQGDFLLA